MVQGTQGDQDSAYHVIYDDGDEVLIAARSHEEAEAIAKRDGEKSVAYVAFNQGFERTTRQGG